jgi:hypothetical protein
MTLQLRSGIFAATMIAAAVLGSAPAHADMLFTLTGTLHNRAPSNLDPLGLEGASFTFQAIFAEGAVYGSPKLWGEGTPQGPGTVAPVSHSFTISGATAAAANGAFVAQNPNGILFTANQGGQFRPANANGAYDYGGAIQLLVGGHTFQLQNLLTAVNVSESQLFAGNALQAHHFGSASSNFDFTMPGNSYVLSNASVSVTSFEPTGVPEPTTTAVFGIGGAAAAFGALRRRFRRKEQESAEAAQA